MLSAEMSTVTRSTERRIMMNTQEFPQDKYGYDIPRCHYLDPTTGERCPAPPQTGTHLCFHHDPVAQAKRYEAARKAGRHRQREAPLVVPVGLPRIALETPADVAALYEETINFVRTGEMDHRVASTIGYLAMGWLQAFQTQFRAERQVILDREEAQEKARAEQRAEAKAQEAKAQEAQAKNK